MERLTEHLGLTRKYIVKKADTGEEVKDCFVLCPREDWAARHAVRAYASMTRNSELSKALLKWVGEIPLSSYDPDYARIDQSNLQLKPCPRCGEEGLIVYEGPAYYYAECKKCPIELHEIYFSPESAAEAWNYRAENPNEPLTLEELREMGEDWVWIKFLMPVYGMESGYYLKKSPFSDSDKFSCGYSAPKLVVGDLPYGGYGAVWLAYRRRPEENV